MNNPAAGGFDLLVQGVIPGKTNLLQASTTLMNWITVSTNVLPLNAPSNTFGVADTSAGGVVNRFYRVLQLP